MELLMVLQVVEVKKKVTIQQHPICFVIGLLMYESVHFAGLFLAYRALLNSYSAWVIALFRY
jgi:hypothetical protein